MATASSKGRPIALLQLSAEGAIWSGKCVATASPDRCLSGARIILRCADGLPSKSVAAAYGN